MAGSKMYVSDPNVWRTFMKKAHIHDTLMMDTQLGGGMTSKHKTQSKLIPVEVADDVISVTNVTPMASLLARAESNYKRKVKLDLPRVPLNESKIEKPRSRKSHDMNQEKVGRKRRKTLKDAKPLWMDIANNMRVEDEEIEFE